MSERSGDERRPGRPQVNWEQTPARFTGGTLARIDAVLTSGEKRADFIRTSVEKEIEARQGRNEEEPGEASTTRGPLGRAMRVADIVKLILEDPRKDPLVRYPDTTRSELKTAQHRAYGSIVEMWTKLQQAED